MPSQSENHAIAMAYVDEVVDRFQKMDRQELLRLARRSPLEEEERVIDGVRFGVSIQLGVIGWFRRRVSLEVVGCYDDCPKWTWSVQPPARYVELKL